MSNIRIPLVAAMTLSLCALALPVRAEDNSEKNNDGESQGVYLALGDSVPFGYNPTIAVRLNKYVGFPKLVGEITDADVANASCPFETTGSLLTPNGCPWLQAGQPLYVNYGGGSQIDFAVNFLQTHKVSLVTLMIGGNDLAQLLAGCKGDPLCAQAGLPVTLGTIGHNLAIVFTRIRATGYTGPIVVENYYGFNYNDPLTTGAFQALGLVISNVAAPFGVKVADGFGAFKAASAPFGYDACAAGLLIKKTGGVVGGVCDTHPSRLGQAVLAGAVMAALGNNQNDQ